MDCPQNAEMKLIELEFRTFSKLENWVLPSFGMYPDRWQDASDKSTSALEVDDKGTYVKRREFRATFHNFKS